MAGDFPDVPFVASGGHGGTRSQTQMAVIHATDNTASAAGEASYATHRTDGTSAHFYGDDGAVIQGVPLALVAYGCWPTGNSRSVQFELCGLSNKLTDATMRRIAPIVRRVCDKYGLPIRHVSPAELRAGVKGICGHGDVTQAWNEGDHTDPGPAFPWDTFISYVKGVSSQEEPMIFKAVPSKRVFITDGLHRRYIGTPRDLQDLQYVAKLNGITVPDPLPEIPDANVDGGGPFGGDANAQPTVTANVDAAAVAAALAGNAAFLGALAKAVNDDAAARLAQ